MTTEAEITTLAEPAAVLWDLDGTLVDSERLWREAEFEFLESKGLPWSHEAGKRLVGGSLDIASDVIAEVTGVRFTVEELKEGLMGIFFRKLTEGIPWAPGALDLVSAVAAAGAPQALVTSSEREVAELVAEAAGGRFAAIVSRGDVDRPKPDPEPYRRAVGLLGLDAGECLAFEDSRAGVTSAAGAGVRVVAVGAEHPGAFASVPALDRLEVRPAAGVPSLVIRR
ncbi:MAG TPA: HAD family phosphatase [Solirubrobacterales bacterium]|jgi:HAD superfamily hydrolase (TIGR01509 family)